MKSNITPIINYIPYKFYDASTNVIQPIQIDLSGILLSHPNVSVTYSHASYHVKSAGTQSIIISDIILQNSDASYYQLTTNSLIIPATIIPKDVSGSFVAYSKIYDGTVEVLSGPSVLYNIIDSDDVQLIISSAEFSTTTVETNKLVTATSYKLSGNDSSNYHVISQPTTTADIIPKDVSGTFEVYDREYDETVEVEVSGTPIVNGKSFDDDVFLIISSAVMNDSNVGVDKMVTATAYDLSGGTANNYRILNAPTTRVTIYPRNIIDISGSFMVETREYDGTVEAKVISTNIYGVQPDDQVELVVSSAEFSSSIAETNKIVTATHYKLSGSDAFKYKLISAPTTTADIIPRDISGTFEVYDKEYDGVVDVEVSGTPIVNGKSFDDDVFLIISSAVMNEPNIGVDKLATATTYDLSGGTANNYRILNAPTTRVTIYPRDISGSFVAQTKRYDGTLVARVDSTNIYGVHPDDEVRLVVSSAEFLTSNVGMNKIVTATNYELSGNDAFNYQLNTLPSTFSNIIPRDISGTFFVKDKFFDGTLNADVLGTPVLNGKIMSDDVFLTINKAEFNDSTIGTNKLVSVIEYELLGNSASNYNLVLPLISRGNILSKIDVSGTFSVKDKQFDGTVTAELSGVPTINGKLLGDNVFLVINKLEFSDSSLGANKVVTAIEYELSGNDVFKYRLVNVPTSIGSILPRDISGTFFVKDKFFDGTLKADVSGVPVLDGKITGDDVFLIVNTAEFNDIYVGDYKLVTATSYDLSGNDINKYRLRYVPIGVGKILPEPFVQGELFEEKVEYVAEAYGFTATFDYQSGVTGFGFTGGFNGLTGIVSSFTATKIVDLENINLDLSYKYIQNVELVNVDLSFNPKILDLTLQINQSLEKINSEKLQNIGTIAEYAELITIVNTIDSIKDKIKLDMSLNNLTEMAELVNEIAEIFKNFNTKIETVLNIITIDELTIVRDYLESILRMLEAHEQFIMTIHNQFVVKGEYTKRYIANTLDCVYHHLDHLFYHNNCTPVVPIQVLTNFCPVLQDQINNFCDYSKQLDCFAESIGILERDLTTDC